MMLYSEGAKPNNFMKVTLVLKKETMVQRKNQIIQYSVIAISLVICCCLFFFLTDYAEFRGDNKFAFRQQQQRKLQAIDPKTVVMKNSATGETFSGDPWQPKTKASVCNPSRPLEDFDESWFKSQREEDRKLMKWFGSLCGGTYLEMGGLDGVWGSNSYVFNNGLDWKGVLIEAAPKNYEDLKKNRQNDLFTVHSGVCGKEQMLHWVDNGNAATQGFQEFASESFQKRWWKEKDIKQAKLVKCRLLKDILFETVGSRFFFDFFSLDIEGAEFEALASLDFDLVSFGIIFVESDSTNELKNMALRRKLESNGYTFIMDFARSYWFVNNDFGRIYSDVIH